jgi:hypothetical protein
LTKRQNSIEKRHQRVDLCAIISIISAVSIGSILLVEPTFALLVFNQLPSRGAAIGFVLGAIGLVVALID